MWFSSAFIMLFSCIFSAIKQSVFLNLPKQPGLTSIIPFDALSYKVFWHLHVFRVLTPTSKDGFGSARSESFVRHLLLVPSIQLDIQSMLLEKIPEYFDVNPEHLGTSLSLEDDVARLIINQFRWLDFIVDPDVFTDKLMQVLSICPLHLKKEIIGSLPEIIGDQNNRTVVDGLEQMLQEDSSIIVPVLDSLSNLNLDDQLQEQVFHYILETKFSSILNRILIWFIGNAKLAI